MVHRRSRCESNRRPASSEKQPGRCSQRLICLLTSQLLLVDRRVQRGVAWRKLSREDKSRFPQRRKGAKADAKFFSGLPLRLCAFAGDFSAKYLTQPLWANAARATSLSSK